MRTAINLPDVAIGDGPGQIKRGDVITVVDLGKSSAGLIVLLEKSSRVGPKDPAARPLKNGASVYLHHGTSRFPTKIGLLDSEALEPGKRMLARLKLDSSTFAFLGDRFVLRDASEQHTVAGGVVLDPDGEREKFLLKEPRESLTTRAPAPHDLDLCVRSEIALRGFVPMQTALRKSSFSAAEIGEALLRLQRRNEIVIYEEIAADVKTWEILRSRASLLIDNAHKKNPERVGLDLNDLRTTLRDLPANVFEALLSDLCSDSFVRKGSAIARISHRPALPNKLQLAAIKIREALSDKPFDTPARKEIALDGSAQQVLQFLIESGEVIEVNTDVVLLRENFERMKSAVVDFISRNERATVSELRQELQTSRRIMVPFLEQLDRCGVTRRAGDQRTVAH